MKHRGDAAKKIISMLEEKPATPNEIIKKLDISQSTVYANLKALKDLGVIKQLRNDKYADKCYTIEEDEVRESYRRLRDLLLRQPKPEEIAYFIKKTPEETRNLLFKYIKGYYEPTNEEVEKAADKVWNFIFWGSNPGLPDELDYDKYSEIWLENFDRDEFWKDVFPIDPPVNIDEAKSYLNSFPEMKPRIVWEAGQESIIGQDAIIIEAKWKEDVLIYISKFPKYGQFFSGL